MAGTDSKAAAAAPAALLQLPAGCPIRPCPLLCWLQGQRMGSCFLGCRFYPFPGKNIFTRENHLKGNRDTVK